MGTRRITAGIDRITRGLTILVLVSSGVTAHAAAEPPSDATVRANLIQRTYFGSNRVASVREDGHAAIRRERDPEVLLALARVLSDERDDVRGVLLEHLDASGEPGDAILAWLAITDDDPRLRGAAARRIASPATPATTRVITWALADGATWEIDRAAELAAWVEAIDVIPHLVQRLSTSRIVRTQGYGGRWRRSFGPEGWCPFVFADADLLVPETIPGSESLLPGLGRTGVFVGRGSRRTTYRRIDSVRPAVHRSLVALARLAHGPDVPDLGVDQQPWWNWLAEVTPQGPPRP